MFSQDELPMLQGSNMHSSRSGNEAVDIIYELKSNELKYKLLAYTGIIEYLFCKTRQTFTPVRSPKEYALRVRLVFAHIFVGT